MVQIYKTIKYEFIHVKDKTLNQTESGSREAHFSDHGSEVLVMV